VARKRLRSSAIFAGGTRSHSSCGPSACKVWALDAHGFVQAAVAIPDRAVDLTDAGDEQA